MLRRPSIYRISEDPNWKNVSNPRRRTRRAPTLLKRACSWGDIVHVESAGTVYAHTRRGVRNILGKYIDNPIMPEYTDAPMDSDGSVQSVGCASSAILLRLEAGARNSAILKNRIFNSYIKM